jgi:predicted DNA-binding protein
MWRNDMMRTIITLPRDLKNWLDSYSKAHNKPTAETIREAIVAYKTNVEKKSYSNLLKKTKGIWKDRNIDGLDYVESLRGQWE